MAILRVFGHFKLYKGGGRTYTAQYQAMLQERGGDLYQAIVQKSGGGPPQVTSNCTKRSNRGGDHPSLNTGVIENLTCALYFTSF